MNPHHTFFRQDCEDLRDGHSSAQGFGFGMNEEQISVGLDEINFIQIDSHPIVAIFYKNTGLLSFFFGRSPEKPCSTPSEIAQRKTA